MHVVLATHGARVAQALRDRIDGAQDVAVGLAPARGRPHRAQLHRREHGPAPRAEVLGRHVAPGELAQVRVHVVGGNRLALVVRVEVLEQLVPRQVLAALDDARKARLLERDAVLDAALAAKSKGKTLAVDAHVPAAQRGEAEGLVLARVLVVAHADERAIQQPHHRGKELAARMVRGAQIVLDAIAQQRQHLAELEHMPELRVVARVAVGGVIAVLLATARVARGRLNVAVGIGTDPDLAPGRRDRERVDPLALAPIDDAHAVRQIIGPAAADALARDAALVVGDVAQPGARRGGAAMRDAGAPVLALMSARRAAQSAARMPALRISCVHLSISLATMASVSLPERRCVRYPRFCRPAVISGMASTLSKSARSRARIGAGVPARTK